MDVTFNTDYCSVIGVGWNDKLSNFKFISTYSRINTEKDNQNYSRTKGQLHSDCFFIARHPTKSIHSHSWRCFSLSIERLLRNWGAAEVTKGYFITRKSKNQRERYGQFAVIEPIKCKNLTFRKDNYFERKKYHVTCFIRYCASLSLKIVRR